jgi:hypothetical protein
MNDNNDNIKNEQIKLNEEPEKKNSGMYIALGSGIGTAIGVALGIALDMGNIGIGIGIGLAIGAGIGIVLEYGIKNK